MSYSEAHDFATHIADIEGMDWHLQQANAIIDWRKSIILDVGGAGGLHAAILAPRCRRIYFTDLIDCNLQYNGEFIRLLSEKCQRNGLSLPMAKIEFHAGNAMEMIYRDGLFDFVCSFNAFEHIPEPRSALSEMARVARPGGLIYISFDPIWTADSGSHFAHFHDQEPWAHLVYDPDRFEKLIRMSGATDNDIHEFRFAMNRVRLSDFEDIFNSIENKGYGEIIMRNSWSGTTHPDNLMHPNMRRALSLGYSEQELLTRGMVFLIKISDPRKP